MRSTALRRRRAFDEQGDVYTTLFETAMLGQKDCGGLIKGYLSGGP